MESKECNQKKVAAKFNCTQDEVLDKVAAANMYGPFSDPVYKQLSRINGEINRMHKEELQSRLAALHLDTRGNKEILKKRMKYHYKKAKLIKSKSSDGHGAVQHFDYFCVIDFEATCEEPNPVGYQHEIIEFPAVLVSVHNREIVDEFHEYCRPSLHPKLTGFCTQLTGITQSQVDEAASFSKVLEKFEEWLQRHRLGTDFKFVIVTDGPWDMGRFLHTQCCLSGIEFPKYAKKWVNIRKTYSNFYQCKRLSLKQMLELLDLQFVGRPHCGLDDARNISRVLLYLVQDGASLRINERIDLKSECRVVPVNRKSVAVRSSPVKNWQPCEVDPGHQLSGSLSSEEEEEEESESVDPEQLSDFSKFINDWSGPLQPHGKL